MATEMVPPPQPKTGLLAWFQNRSKWQKISGGLAAVVVLAAVVIGIVIVVLLPSLGGLNPPEHSARFYPEDTAVYLWATLAPGNGQRGNMQEIWDAFQRIPAFEDLLDQLKDDVEDEAEIDLEDDLMPWIGPSISAAMLDQDEADSLRRNPWRPGSGCRRGFPR